MTELDTNDNATSHRLNGALGIITPFLGGCKQHSNHCV